jgi:hypothetical protein
MTQLWRNPFRLTQTQGLWIGVLIGYSSFVVWLGMRWIVLISGAFIVVLAIASWHIHLHTQKASRPVTSANLLQTDIFLSHINILNSQVPEACQSLWRSAQDQAQAIQQTAIQIAQQESTFIPDLLETLHTVLDLVDQLVQALQVTQQVQTLPYQELAQTQLQSSLDRLQQTQDQLQELRDQMALASLQQRSRITPSGIAARLQILVTENEKGILGD